MALDATYISVSIVTSFSNLKAVHATCILLIAVGLKVHFLLLLLSLTVSLDPWQA